jgi:hypothetical protein
MLKMRPLPRLSIPMSSYPLSTFDTCEMQFRDRLRRALKVALEGVRCVDIDLGKFHLLFLSSSD